MAARQGSSIFDITVIGAGIEGSATAYQLSKSAPGKRIALVEQVRWIHSCTPHARYSENTAPASIFFALYS